MGCSPLQVKEAIILAAGYGTRIRDIAKDTPKPLLKVFNIPLIVYPIANFLSAGVEKFYIVANPHNYKAIKEFISKTNINAEFIVNKDPERGNGLSLILAMEHVNSKNFYLSMSDHIHSPKIIEKFSGYHGDVDIIVGADSNPTYINVDEATKILVVNGEVVDIGKHLNRYTHVDIGLFVMSKELYETFRRYSEKYYDVPLSKLIKYSVGEGFKVVALDVQGSPWIDIDTIDDLNRINTIARNVMNDIIKRLAKYINSIMKKASSLHS